MDLLDLLTVQGTLKSLLQHHSSKASILRCSAFFTVQLSHPYMTTGKTIALTKQSFVGKVMSLLFNMLSRLVITFLPRSKGLLISWLQSPSAVILEPLTLFPLFPHLFPVSLWQSHSGLGSGFPEGWRRKWQATPAFLPIKYHGQRSLARYCPWGRKSWTRLSD